MMQVSKDYIRKDIMTAAQKLFLKKGYDNVSMREIASKAQVGLSNMYNYFKNKDDLFRTIVSPATTAMEKIILRHDEKDGENLVDLQSDTFLRNTISEYLTVLKKYRKETYLLLFCARGSSLQNFKEEFVDKTTPLIMEELKNQQRQPLSIDGSISEFFINLHTVWMFALMEELLKKKMKDAEMETILNEYIRFEVLGWRALTQK